MCITLLMLFVFISPPSPAACEFFPLAVKAATESKLVILDELQPQPLIGDFNGDGEADLALFVADRVTKKHGVCMLHAGSSECEVLGAGHSFHAGGDDFRWVDQWQVIRKGETWETTFRADGDVLGSRESSLENASIRLCAREGGCGVVTHRNGRYQWVHQAD